MKNFYKLILITLAIFNLSIYSQVLNIIPKPVKVSAVESNYLLNEGSFINIKKTNGIALNVANQFKDYVIKRTGVKLEIKNSAKDLGIIFIVDNAKIKEKDGYSLSVNKDYVKVVGNNASGLFYGMQTVKMILDKTDNLFIHGCEIYDYPRYGYRGFMLDASRHFQSPQYVKKVLDVMALLKLNVFHWHLIDDEGWRIESKKYTKLNSVGSYRDSLNAKERNGYYTVKEIQEIIKYAANLHIKIIPEIEMPGHSRSVMESYPELLCPTAKDGNTYCAGNPKSYEFLKNVTDEIIDIFKPEIMHVGGDERPKGVWEKCPNCKSMIEEKGLVNEDMLQNYFMKEICDHISKRGVKTLAWFENIKDGVPQNQIVEGWHPGDSWNAANRNLYTVNADNWYVYFDYPSYPRTDKPNWMPVLNLKRAYSFNPTPDSLDVSKHKFILGSECALWTELVLENDVQYQIFPRILALAEVVWSTPEKDFENFLTRVTGIKSFINYNGFEYEKGKW